MQQHSPTWIDPECGEQLCLEVAPTTDAVFNVRLGGAGEPVDVLAMPACTVAGTLTSATSALQT